VLKLLENDKKKKKEKKKKEKKKRKNRTKLCEKLFEEWTLR